jgi:hypothetical protein
MISEERHAKLIVQKLSPACGWKEPEADLNTQKKKSVVLSMPLIITRE